MTSKELYSNLVLNIQNQLPIICFSITNNELHITTKKVGSRFFEYLTEDTKYIEFRIKHKSKCLPEELNNESHFLDLILFYFNDNSVLNLQEFFDILNINSFNDILTKEFSQRWKVTFIIRNPILRFLSGYVELVDSSLSSLLESTSSIDNDVYSIIKKYDSIAKKNNSYYSIKDFSINESNLILNYFANTFDSSIMNDEHISNWNTIVYYLLEQMSEKPKILDLDNLEDMRLYGQDNTFVSNKSIYENWLSNDENKEHILNLFNKLNYFILPEYSFFQSLILIK